MASKITEKKSVRSNLSSMLLDKIDTERQVYKTLEDASIQKTINRNSLFLDRFIDTQSKALGLNKAESEAKYNSEINSFFD